MYVKRHAEAAVNALKRMFGAVFVAGPRQAGKTTMLKQLASGMQYATLDDPMLLNSAIAQSGTFFKDNPPPIFIDEIQKAPGLFPHIKLMLDSSKLKGQFFLSGSQQFHMMKNIGDSLAGRLGLITLLGLSMRESYGVAFDKPFLPEDAYYAERRRELADFTYDDVWAAIQRGSLPEMRVNADYDWQMYYGAYVSTYIERDVRELTQVGDESRFMRFMIAAAACTGQLVNLAALSRDVGVSQPTAERWLSILAASNIVYLLKPYSNNITKRVIKTPKLYFLDTGLAAYLTRWNTPDALKNGAMAGAFFESFAVAEIIKSYYNRGIPDPPLYFYRDKDMREIDLLIAEGDTLYPLEMKKHADPDKRDTRAFSALDGMPNIKRGPGGVICMYDRLITLRGEDRAIPVWYL